MCAFISCDLAEGELVYMKAPPGYDMGEGNCLSMKKYIHGLDQAPRQYYLLCREVYGRSGLQRLRADECVIVRYVSNIKGQPQLTNEDFLKKRFEHIQLPSPPRQARHGKCQPVQAAHEPRLRLGFSPHS